MPNSLMFAAGFSNNAVFVLDGLGKTDKPTGLNLFHALERMEKPGTLCRHFKIGSREELFRILDDVLEDAGNGLRPILHFEVHGGPTQGIGLGDSEETASWRELCGYFQRLNVLTKNNLGVVMAACFGLYAVKEVSIKEPSPFHFYMGSQEQVDEDLIDAQMKEFYRVLFRTGLLENAMRAVDKTFQQFHVEAVFATSFGRFIRRGLVEGRQVEHIKRIVDQHLANAGLPLTEENAAPLRVKFTEQIRRQHFEKFANIFMIGRYALTYDAVVEWAIQSKSGT